MVTNIIYTVSRNVICFICDICDKQYQHIKSAAFHISTQAAIRISAQPGPNTVHHYIGSLKIWLEAWFPSHLSSSLLIRLIMPAFTVHWVQYSWAIHIYRCNQRNMIITEKSTVKRQCYEKVGCLIICVILLGISKEPRIGFAFLRSSVKNIRFLKMSFSLYKTWSLLITEEEHQFNLIERRIPKI